MHGALFLARCASPPRRARCRVAAVGAGRGLLCSLPSLCAVSALFAVFVMSSRAFSLRLLGSSIFCAEPFPGQCGSLQEAAGGASSRERAFSPLSHSAGFGNLELLLGLHWSLSSNTTLSGPQAEVEAAPLPVAGFVYASGSVPFVIGGYKWHCL